jgi:hypothetical protein
MSVNRTFASRFRGISQEITAGRGAWQKLLFAPTKPINPARIFASFCNFFFQKEKVGIRKKR